MTSPRAWLGLPDEPKPLEPSPIDPTLLWWERPPWNGQIPVLVFREVIALYIAQFGYYQPDLPTTNPELLTRYLEEHRV